MSDAFTFTITPPTIQRGRSSGSLSATRSRTPSQSRGMSPSLKRASQDSLAAQFAQTSVSAPLDPLENGTLLYSAPQGGEPDFSMLEPGDPLWQSNLDLNMAGQSGFIPGQNVTFITGDLSSILGASAGVAYDGSNLGYQNLVNVGMSYYPLDATENYAPDRSPSPNGSGSWNELHGNGSSASGTRSASTTFVHKLYQMVNDPTCQSLIGWTSTGTSFVVVNAVEFGKEVLPKYYKHNNFSSFVRQLNMYGFHKVNKVTRGSKQDNNVWEFSHPKFHRDHPQLLDEIKRKSIDPATSPPSPVSSDVQLQILQLQYTEMSTQYQQLQSVLTATVKELVEVKKRQEVQGAMMREMAGYLLEMKRQRVQDTSADALSRQGLQDNAHELQATGAAVSDGMHPKVFGDGRFLSEEEMRILQDKD